jgi:hypothetical protein
MKYKYIGDQNKEGLSEPATRTLASTGTSSVPVVAVSSTALYSGFNHHETYLIETQVINGSYATSTLKKVMYHDRRFICYMGVHETNGYFIPIRELNLNILLDEI